MTRMIDADNLIPMMKYATTDNEIGVFQIRIGFDTIKGVIDDAPTIDAVEVVRCKDCEYAVGQSFEGYLHCDVLKILIDETGYCSYGVRR